MSQHSITHENKTWKFGWDQPLMSFFLQVHDTNLDEEENPFVWIVNGMYEVEDLVKAADKNGLTLSHPMRMLLYRDRDNGD